MWPKCSTFRRPQRYARSIDQWEGMPLAIDAECGL
jgi:hypothetical protein